MQNSATSNAKAQIASFVDWWKLAGVEYLVEENTLNWLTLDKRVAPPPQAVHRPVVQTPDVAPAADIADSDWPIDIESLKQQIAAKVALPGNCYGGNPVIPVGSKGAALMLILDIPEIADVESGHFGGGEIGGLIGNMVKAMGFSSDQIYLTAMATTRPAIGELPDGAQNSLAPFMRHQIKLVAPKSVILFGSSASHALLGADMMQSRGTLHNFNHDVGNMTALTTFHPRTLLAQPKLKAQAWKDLQMIAKKDAL